MTCDQCLKSESGVSLRPCYVRTNSARYVRRSKYQKRPMRPSEPRFPVCGRGVMRASRRHDQI